MWVQVRGDEEVAASFGAQDEVEFEVIVNRRSGGHRAEAVQLLCRAQDRRELGQVCACPGLVQSVSAIV